MRLRKKSSGEVGKSKALMPPPQTEGIIQFREKITQMLFLYIKRGDTEKAAKALRAGANPNALQSPGWTPMHEAADKGHASVILALFKYGGNPNARTFFGETPLHRAAQHGHIDAIKMLLAIGADPTAKTKEGKTPTNYAKEYGKVKAFNLLKKAEQFYSKV